MDFDPCMDGYDSDYLVFDFVWMTTNWSALILTLLYFDQPIPLYCPVTSLNTVGLYITYTEGCSYMAYTVLNVDYAIPDNKISNY